MHVYGCASVTVPVCASVPIENACMYVRFQRVGMHVGFVCNQMVGLLS